MKRDPHLGHDVVAESKAISEAVRREHERKEIEGDGNQDKNRKKIEDSKKAIKVYSNVMNTLEDKISELPKLSEGYKEAVTEQKYKTKASLNAVNAAFTVAYMLNPEFKIANTIIGGAGVLDDIQEGNNWQTAAGIVGLGSPLIRAINPTITYTKKSIDAAGRLTHTPYNIQLGTSGGITADLTGLAGDMYGFIINDKGRLLTKTPIK